MKPLTAFLCAVLFHARLWAVPQPTDGRSDYDYELPQTSPNGKYAIEFAETRNHVMLYRWVRIKPRKVLLGIKSSYQPDKNETDSSYSRGYAEDAMAFWSRDSRYVAIDEKVNHGSGKTFAAFLVAPDKAQLITIPEDEIDRATGEQWRRGRFWFHGWGNNGKLYLTDSGYALADKNDTSDTAKQKRVAYSITLQQKGTRFLLKSVQKVKE